MDNEEKDEISWLHSLEKPETQSFYEEATGLFFYFYLQQLDWEARVCFITAHIHNYEVFSFLPT